VYPIVSFSEYTLELWNEVHAVNVTGAFIAARELRNVISRGGRIVTVVSGAAHVGSRDLGYSASKAALLGLTKSLAMNLAEQGILVNAVCPGPIESAMSQRMPAERVGEYKQKMLLGRFGTPEEVASVVDFLLSPENSFMTGATVDVNGGQYLR
jgi:3-oxoacyl-[acyl-carrier protein] reductase